jgi:histone acetyltransferase SAS3
MANAQLMEEELQQSVVLSEEDAEFEEDDVVQDATMADINVSLNPVIDRDRDEHRGNEETFDEGGQQENSDVDMESYDSALSKPRQRGVQEGNPTNDEDALHVDEDSESEDNDTHDDDDGAFDIDAEGEDEEEEEIGRIRQKHHGKEDSESSGESEELVEEDGEDDNHEDEEEEEEEEEAEGVGAVKIRPGETDDEDSDSVSSETSASDFSDRESIAEWDDPVENDDDGDGDDESDAADSPMCVFCKKTAGHDFTGAVDSSLVCKGCGEHGMFFCLDSSQTFCS